MPTTLFIAHRRDDGAEQLLVDHLKNVAELASSYAQAYGGGFAYVCGLVHDIGKYSLNIQKRIHGAKIKVDHATAGGQLLVQTNNKSLALISAYCIMGHHGGIPDGGTNQDNEKDPTLIGRILRQLDLYNAYKNEIEIPKIEITIWYYCFVRRGCAVEIQRLFYI